MNKSPLVLLALTCAAIGAAQSQENLKPLTQGELLKTIDSIGLGDPLTKQPLSVGEDKPTRKAEPAAKKDKGPTEITALEATFDNKSHLAVFIGDVVVKDPEFNVECDRLDAYLKHDDKPPVDKTAPVKPVNVPGHPAATPVPAPKAEKSDKQSKGGLEKAIAVMTKGGQVLITQDKVESDGTVSHNIGRGKKAVYDAVTGDITLTGMPTVQQGINTCIALDEGTVMILNREGRMRVIGLHKTVIKDTNSADSKPENK